MKVPDQSEDVNSFRSPGVVRDCAERAGPWLWQAAKNSWSLSFRGAEGDEESHKSSICKSRSLAEFTPSRNTGILRCRSEWQAKGLEWRRPQPFFTCLELKADRRQACKILRLEVKSDFYFPQIERSFW